MPFFFLLSGFVMTLGYGQSEYGPAGCCCGRRACAHEDEDLGKPTKKKRMDKSKFWRNRFARLAPVYYVTNISMSAIIFEQGGMGLNGTHQGLLGAILQGICTLLGINSWLFPFIDVGMPLNGVTWTITTMSFFYLIFPWILPTMQGMTPEQRRVAIVSSFWLQMVSYFGLLSLYEFVIPVAQFVPEVDESGLQLGSWRAGLDYDYAPNYSYWVARAWPVTRVLVFAMGCLAALNRVEANKRQALLDSSGVDKFVGQQQEQQTLLPREMTDRQHCGAELSGPSPGYGYLECPECRSWLRPSWVLSIPTLVTDRHSGTQAKEMRRQWARRADLCAFLYLFSVTGVVLVERFVMPLEGRMWLEGILPGLELHLIVALTYDSRQSFTSRFCNWSPVQWFGNLSMCFYMVHMFAAFILLPFQMAVQDAVNPSSCTANYVRGNGELACSNLGFPAAPGQYWLAVALVPVLGPAGACDTAEAGPDFGVWVSCPELPPSARYGEACGFSGSVEAGDDTCAAYYTEELSASYCPFEAATSCSFLGTIREPPDGVGNGPDDLISVAQYCTNCLEAWSTQFVMLEWYLIPLAVAWAALWGWFLMRWVELPAQTWLRGDSWQWISTVTCFPSCCPFELGCMPPWMPSCMPWECCPCIYTIFCCCFCGCFQTCRNGRQPSRSAYEPLPPAKP
jgi:peptidoglycan/LPS O-acetylase OafA/YrhL